MCDTHEPPREELVPSSNANVFETGESSKLAIGREAVKGKKKKSKRWAKKKGQKSVAGQGLKGEWGRRKRRLDDR